MALTGHTILVVEDEPLIAFDIGDCLRAAGASVLTAHTPAEALRMAAQPNLSAAVVDYRLGDGDGAALCKHLQARGLPFVVYTGYPNVPDVCRSGIILAKPAGVDRVMNALVELLVPALRTAQP